MNYTDTKKELPHRTIELTVQMPWEEVEKFQEKALDELVKTVEIEGFRKGKAPREKVNEKLGQQRLLEEAAQQLMVELYRDLLKKHDVKPYIDPKISLLKAPTGGTWEIRFTIALAPELVRIPDYKKIAAAVRAELKKDTIWVPGK